MRAFAFLEAVAFKAGWKRLLAALVCLMAIHVRGDDPKSNSGQSILQELRTFGEMGTVLHIAAHPDDENTQLITYLARGRGYRTGYLSLTRGDGGQNLLGPEFREQLGVARTQELLAARRLDGGRQFFTRACDFGFSKDYRETLRIWDKQQVLADMVYVIRSFRPDVLITRFSPQPGGTHGHHTASAVLALEAFKLAGDPKAFPEQLGAGGLTVWQPKRIFQNGGGGNAKAIRMDVGGLDPVLNESFATIAARSRAQHETQGFANFTGGAGGGPRFESFLLLDGETATKDILDGVDTTWARVPGGAEIGKLTTEAIAQFNPQDPSASIPALLRLCPLVVALPVDPLVSDKRQQLDRLIQHCLGLQVKTSVDQAEAVAGEKLKLQHSVSKAANVRVRWVGVRYPSVKQEVKTAVDLKPADAAIKESTQSLPASTPLSQPYWLREEGTIGMFRMDVPALTGRPENPPAFPVEHIFEVGGQTLVIADEPVQVSTNQAGKEVRRRLEVIPPVSLKFVSDVKLFAPNMTKAVEVEVTASRANANGTVRLIAPTGWKIAPATQAFKLATVGAKAKFAFAVTSPAGLVSEKLTAEAEVKGVRYVNQRVEIRYPHIPPQLLQPPARIKVVNLDLNVRGKQIGYLAGAGDDVARCMEQMGYVVTQLKVDDFVPEKLKELDAVVIGIRALNLHPELGDKLPALFSFVETGGNVLVQYNRPENLKLTKFAPYNLRLSLDRVAEEDAEVTILAPDHPALNTPNKIMQADFAGWVQERGAYFANQWDDQFTPLLSMHDNGETPKSGSVLVAKHGKGYFVYSGLAWFRQLPEGVPGAYRLFANLVSLGK